MGGGASKAEKLDGTAVTGKWQKRVVMPPGTIGEQMAKGPYPGKKFLRFTPRRLQELNAAKGTTSLYLEFEKTIVDECGGNKLTGWQSKKIHEVVSRYQARFNEKGLHVAYSMVKWYVQHGQGGHMEYRHWLTFSDMATVVTGELLTEGSCTYDPKKDYDKMDEDEEQLYKSDDPLLLVSTPVDGMFTSFDPTGRWVADMSTATGAVKTWLKKAEYSCTKNGSTYEMVSTFTYRYFGGKGPYKSNMQPIPNEPGTFMIISHDGEYSKAAINSPNSITCNEMSGKWSVTFNRSQ